MTHIEEEIRGIQKRKNCYEALIGWLRHLRNDDTWEPIHSILEDIPVLLENYLNTAVERNLKREILDLYY